MDILPGRVCTKVYYSRQVLRQDESKSQEMPIFLEFSPSGVVEGDVVYANFGTVEDFKQLDQWNVSLKNKIVIVRQGRLFRGNKVHYFFLSARASKTNRILQSDWFRERAEFSYFARGQRNEPDPVFKLVFTVAMFISS